MTVRASHHYIAMFPRVNKESVEIREWMELLEPQDCLESLVETD